MIYGSLPTDLGLIDLSPAEMMFWMYCPIKVPGWQFCLPPQLRQFEPIVTEVKRDMMIRVMHSGGDLLSYMESVYVYLTAKTLWVSGDYIGNRPGWHIDGFGTKDVNYIWSDRAPTEFVGGAFLLSDDCDKSMEEMEAIGYAAEWHDKIVTYPDKHLLRLDPRVIHRSPDRFERGMRTFVKVSISTDRYDLIGNSINHDLPASHWPLVDRKLTRNHPQSRAN